MIRMLSFDPDGTLLDEHSRLAADHICEPNDRNGVAAPRQADSDTAGRRKIKCYTQD